MTNLATNKKIIFIKKKAWYYYPIRLTGWIAIRGRTGGGRVANGAGVWARTTRGTRSVRASMAHARRVRVGVWRRLAMVRSVRASIRVESEDGDTRDGETGKARAGVARR
jgi:hypothetical protein